MAYMLLLELCVSVLMIDGRILADNGRVWYEAMQQALAQTSQNPVLGLYCPVPQ